MKIVDIFVSTNNSGEGLYSIKYDEEDENEYERIFGLWNDTEYILDYFESNKNYLESPYFTGLNIDDLVTKVLKEALKIEEELIKLTKEGFENSGKMLQELFRPLDDKEYTIYELQKSKGKVYGKGFHNPILRIYALRISKNTYIITGGAIKLTEKMKEHEDTNHELKKIEKVKHFLNENNLTTEEDLNLFI